MPINPDEVVQYRIRMRRGTRLTVKVLAELMGVSFEEALNLVCLYGTAYINQKNKMELMQWLDGVKLPTVKDVEKFVESQ